MGCSQSTQVIENKKIQRVQKIQKFMQSKSRIRQIPQRSQCFIVGVINKNENVFANVKLQQMSINKMSIPKGFKCNNFSSILQINKNEYIITGGISYDLMRISNQTYIYNCLQHTASKLQSMKQARYTHGSILHNDQVYIIGGRYYGNDQQGILKKCQKYNIKSNQWIQLPQINIKRCTSFICIWNKQIYVFGGYTGPYQRSTQIQFYDENKNIWQTLSIQLNRGLQGAIIIPTNHNQITIFGGLTNSGPTTSVISLNFKNKSIKSRKKLIQKRSLAKSFYKNGKIYIIGGDDNFTGQIYNVQTEQSQIVKSQFPYLIQEFDNLSYSTASVIVPYKQNDYQQKESDYDDQIVYIFGSTQQPFLCQLNISIPQVKIHYIPLQMKLYSYQGGISINKYEFILFGGIEDDSLSVVTSQTYLINVKTKKTLKLNKMNQNKYAFSYEKVINNHIVEYIYCFGGATSNKQGKLVFLNTCERYSIHKNQWQLISPLPQKLISSMSINFNKKLFVFGGTNQKVKKSQQIYQYHQKQNNWITLNIKLPFGLQAGSIIKYNQHQFYLFGGRTENGQIPNIWSIYLKEDKQINIIFQQKGQMKQSKSLHKIFEPKHQDFYVIFGGDRQHLSFYKKKNLIQQTSDLLINMKLTLSETIKNFNNPNLKGYLIITPDS